MDILRDLLINILFLIIFLLFTPLLLEKSGVKSYMKKWIMTSSFCVVVILCISFPIAINDEFIFDLRLVSVIIGGLMGGIPTSIALLITTISFRSIFGGAGIYSTLIISVVHFAFLSIFYYQFKEFSKRKKLIVATVIGFISSISVVLVIIIGFQTPIQPFIIATYIVLQTISIFFIMCLLDVINESVVMRKRLIESEKMELVSHLASSVSHEVRNPLTVVKGFLQMMNQNDIPFEKRKEYLALSLSEVDRANQIIGEYLAFAKPQLAKIEGIDIKEVLEHTIHVITPLANMNSVVITKNFETCLIKSNKQLLQQCFLNITKNSIEAMPNGGFLSIFTKKKDDKFVITISDTGVGMSEEQIKRLGEPYYSTKGEKGTGLGMVTVFRIFSDLNCTVKINSKPDNGTTFIIEMPL
ncbi:ATP-binding protein [Evansella tamaricis]|uniref:Two-component sensor histidine kinase n=1 Tax=Evansella tamaricis TaxID=2069301 RepID=A0ABS6JAP6_9BACI|nr:ATP-binding protein [Evansella tamaricis]MBU9710759.1 two-component sensor histidine kinase [Evansella tamaricis]